MMVLLVYLYVLRQVVDPLRQDCDLDLCGSSIAAMELVLVDDLILLFLLQSQFFHLLYDKTANQVAGGESAT